MQCKTSGDLLMKKDGWFYRFLTEPQLKFEYREEGTPKQEIHNHYYVTVDNRVIKVGEAEFKKLTQGKQIINKTRLVEYEK